MPKTAPWLNGSPRGPATDLDWMKVSADGGMRFSEEGFPDALFP
jgi:hypothetical protein